MKNLSFKGDEIFHFSYHLSLELCYNKRGSEFERRKENGINSRYQVGFTKRLVNQPHFNAITKAGAEAATIPLRPLIQTSDGRIQIDASKNSTEMTT